MAMELIFEWDLNRESKNIIKHGFSFREAMEVFADPQVIHLEDVRHSKKEDRFYAVGKTKKEVVLTVRYTSKGNQIRIFGAAYWRKWKKFYEKNSQPQ